MTGQEYATALRLVAAFYEENPELPLPEPRLAVYSTSGKEDLATYTRALLKACGHVDKIAGDPMFEIVAEFSGLKLRVVEWRNKICAQVQVGTKIIPAHTIPAQPAQEEQVVPEREEAIYEWHCPSILELTTESPCE